MEVVKELFEATERFPPHCPFDKKKLNLFLNMANSFL